ncbi:MAG: SulP family inorganic anion transporter [Alphaproteobacteria bacterium]|nr:MAG: SulP family inorganic anion transporter [Alphaproteobacteria bacterium]
MSSFTQNSHATIGQPIFYNLHFGNLKGDLYGGLTTAVVALPLSLAFGIASGLGASAGLYCAIFLGFFAALFGGSPAQVSGPNGPMTVLMASVVAQFPDRPEMCFAAVILAGVFQILSGGLRLGKYISLVPYPVISGFMSGVGIIIITLQLATLTGHTSFADLPKVIRMMPEYWSDPNWHAVILGLISLSLVLLTPKKIADIVPPPLIALIFGTLLGVFLWPLAPQIGEIPTGFPAMHLPEIGWHDLYILAIPALMLACLSNLDSLMTATVADSMIRIYHKPDKELIGQGIGNIISGLFGGLAGSGATMRTGVNIRAGGRTPISGAFHALILLALVLGLAPLASHIPHAVLAGILLKVGYDIIDWHYIKKFKSAPRFKIFLMLLVVVLTVTVDLITAVLAGVVLAALNLVKSLADAQLELIQPVDFHALDEQLAPDTKQLLQKHRNHIVLYHFQGPLSFGAASGMAQRLGKFDEFHAVFLDMSQVYFVDTSSGLAIEDIIAQIQSKNKKVFLIGLQPPVLRTFRQIGIMKLLNTEFVANTLNQALQRYDQTASV